MATGGLDQVTADTLYVNVSGDTMAGPLQSDAGIRDRRHSYVLNIASSTNLQVGYLLLELPVTIMSHMMKLNLQGYDYSAAGSWELRLGGYAYSGNPVAGWVNCSARLHGGQAKIDTLSAIQFLAKGSLTSSDQRYAIVIGAANSVWAYPQITVEMYGGYSGNMGALTDAWTHSFVTAIPADWTASIPVAATVVPVVLYGTAAPSGVYPAGTIYAQYS